MAMQTFGPRGLSAEMNVTPMIDILLVLIIIFLIIPPPIERGEDALIPQPDPRPRPAPIEPRTLIVQVLSVPGDQLPQVRINRESVPWAGLSGRLRDILKQRAEKVVFVMAEKDVEFETVAQVIDAIHQAGADKVGLMTTRPAGN